MKISRNFAEALIGMDMKKASWILEKLSGTGFDYPEMRIESLKKAYEMGFDK